MKRLAAAVALAAALELTGQTLAQQYPVRPITLVVPFPAGGPTDTLAVGAQKRLSATAPVTARCRAHDSGRTAIAFISIKYSGDVIFTTSTMVEAGGGALK